MKSGLGEFGFGISGDLNQAYPAKDARRQTWFYARWSVTDFGLDVIYQV